MASRGKEVEEGLADLEARPLFLFHVRCARHIRDKAACFESGMDGGVEAPRGASS